MTALNDNEKLIRSMKRDHKKLIKQFDAAIAEARVGTGVHTRLLEAKSKTNERHRDELVKFGVVPSDLGQARKTEYIYVAFLPKAVGSRAEAEALVRAQQLEDISKLNLSDADEAIRAELEAEFPTR